MNIITVIPLIRSRFNQSLSYFTSAEVPVGALVTVPVRSKMIQGIVAASQKASDIKSDIKRASFEIKKLESIEATTFFPASFMEACQTIADFYAAPIGAVIDSLVSDVILEHAGKLALPGSTTTLKPSSLANETSVIQGDDPDRISSWRSLIRQEFARKKSVAVYVPTIEDGQSLVAALEKGIEDYIYFLHGGLSKKKLLEIWKTVAESVHPLVIIATSSFVLLPREDIEMVVIERENGRGWISQKAPYLDSRYAIEVFSRLQGRMLYLADSLLRSETLYRLELQDIAEASPFKWRSISSARDTLVDMRAYKAAENNFRIISPELEEIVQRNRDENTHLFILAVRRGISPTTVCDDCETIVTCRNCSAPVVLHTSKESGKNFFMCHKCGERRSAAETCIVCGSWRLTPLGIGIDRVAADLREKFPHIDILQIDADSTKTETQIAKILQTFYARPGSILLGTEMALHHLREKIEHVAVVSLDSLFALPDFRIQEKVMYTLVRLRGLAVRTVTVQTRKPEEKVFEYGLKGNLSDFYRSTIDERKQFQYPPFSILIKISLEGEKDAISAEMSGVQVTVAPHELDIFPAFTSTVRGKSVIHGLIKIPRGLWPDRVLVEKLRSLPPSVKVKVQPESLL